MSCRATGPGGTGTVLGVAPAVRCGVARVSRSTRRIEASEGCFDGFFILQIAMVAIRRKFNAA